MESLLTKQIRIFMMSRFRDVAGLNIHEEHFQDKLTISIPARPIAVSPRYVPRMFAEECERSSSVAIDTQHDETSISNSQQASARQRQPQRRVGHGGDEQD